MRRLLLVFTSCFFVNVVVVCAQPYKPACMLKRDRYNALLVFDAQRSEDIEPLYYKDASLAHLKFWTETWKRPEQQVTWKVCSPAADNYCVNILIAQQSADTLTVEFSENDQLITTQSFFAKNYEWKRISFKDKLYLDSGTHVLKLKIRPVTNDDTFRISVHSIELVRPSVKERLHQSAMMWRSKAATSNFSKLRYGIFVHWTSQSFPRYGEKKPYSEAVDSFNVENFARQISLTGAGFVTFTTSHAEMFFPAPLHSLDKILPGRTSKRDLIADLIKALDKYNIKLFLYFHLGAASDSVWAKASGLWETDDSKYFRNWKAIIKEAGERYGKQLAGWWFDDGSMNYYYRSPDWEQLYITAKAGNPQRVVTFNTWKLPPPTEFMDYNPGEAMEEPGAFGWLTRNGNGVLNGGTYKGLQSSVAITAEGDWMSWAHDHANYEIPPMRWTPDEFISLIREFIEFRNVPIFNLQIYQDGKLSEESITVFHRANELLKK